MYHKDIISYAGKYYEMPWLTTVGPSASSCIILLLSPYSFISILGILFSPN
jgi:hypothetical protein